MTGYKVVAVQEDGSLTSCIPMRPSSCRNRDCGVHKHFRGSIIRDLIDCRCDERAILDYSLQATIKPNSGNKPLTLFGSLGCAEEFVRDASWFDTCPILAIFKAKYEEAETPDGWGGRSFPPGTVFASEITLIREIGADEE